MKHPAGATGLLIALMLVAVLGSAACLLPLPTCPHCNGAGQFVAFIAPTDGMDGVKPMRTGSKCTLCIGRRKTTLTQSLRYRLTGRAPSMEPPYERYLLDDGR